MAPRPAAKTEETSAPVTPGVQLKQTIEKLRDGEGEVTTDEFLGLVEIISKVTGREFNFDEPEESEDSGESAGAQQTIAILQAEIDDLKKAAVTAKTKAEKSAQSAPSPAAASLNGYVSADHAWSSFEVRQTQKGPMHDIKVYFDQAVKGSSDTALNMYVELDDKLRARYAEAMDDDE